MTLLKDHLRKLVRKEEWQKRARMFFIKSIPLKRLLFEHLLCAMRCSGYIM